MDLKKLVKREITITILTVVLISLGTIALSYALFRTRDEGTSNVITFGDLALEFCKDESCGNTIPNIGRTIGVNSDGGTVTPKNVYPLSDTEGLQTDPYIFKITNTGNLDLYLTLFLEPESEFVTNLIGNDPSGVPYSSYTSVDESEMKIALVENNVIASLSDVRDYNSLSDYKIQNPTKIAPGETKIYKLYVWQREESENVSQGKYFVTNIRAYGEYLINSPASAPNLHSNMIPIKYDEVNSMWVVADKSNANNSWYNYDDQVWANAVTVTEASRSSYQNAVIGTPVLETDILTYMVWIPKYRYKLWNAENGTSTPQEIKIIFESKVAVKSNGSTNGTWLTHPAFTFGNEELDGIWVGKFTTTGEITTACTIETCTTADITIKPNLGILINQTVSSFFYASRSMSRNGNKYGYPNSVNTHMMKNMEWGAVTYLSHSKYGKYGNSMYTEANKEIYVESVYYPESKTGGSTGTTSIQIVNMIDAGTLDQLEYCSYNDITDRGSGKGSCGGGASTTGNIYGIYDMGGSLSEYVMGNMESSPVGSGLFNTGSSGFSNAPEKKYYDLYAHNSLYTSFSRGQLGDATKETLTCLTTIGCSWYSSDSVFIVGSAPWFIRGGSYYNGRFAGAFNFSSANGEANNYSGFRIVHT